jgi:hypothetical protein
MPRSLNANGGLDLSVGQSGVAAAEPSRNASNGVAFVAVRVAGLSGELAEKTLLLLAIPAGFFGVLLGLDYGVRPPWPG